MSTTSRRPSQSDLKVLRDDLAAQRKWRCAVYVACPKGRHPSKIGVAMDPPKRLVSLNTSHWEGIEMPFVKWVHSVNAAKAIENLCHVELAHHGKAMRGEWFDISPEMALETIQWHSLHLGLPLYDDPAQIPLEARVRQAGVSQAELDAAASRERQANGGVRRKVKVNVHVRPMGSI